MQIHQFKLADLDFTNPKEDTKNDVQDLLKQGINRLTSLFSSTKEDNQNVQINKIKKIDFGSGDKNI